MANAPGQGRPRKPIETHQRNGNPGKRDLAKPIKVSRVKPSPPLHYDAAHIEAWHYFVDAIHAMGVLATIDAPAMEMLVDSWCGYRACEAAVQSAGYVDLTEKGSAPSASLKARATLYKEIERMMARFGLTPVARAQLAAGLQGDDKPVSEFQKMLDERNARPSRN